MSNCPCGTNKSYKKCCELIIKGTLHPASAEELMKSRYTAYTIGNMDYIEQTMSGEALKAFDKESAQIWSDTSDWQNLEIIKKGTKKETDTLAFVEFIACYKLNGKTKFLHEVSEFKKDGSKWLYVNNKSSIVHDKNRVLPS
jgi:SEC-C motif domain protein